VTPVEDSIAIMRGIKEKYELHHGIRIQDDAVIAAVELSTRYITDRFLPDKAVDLIDEATSALKIETQSMPVDLDSIKRRMVQLEIEQAALKKEESEASKERLTKLSAELLTLTNTAFDSRFFGQLLLLQARLDILNGYKDFIFQHTNIQIVAGRDANVQISGTHNTQEVNNER
jgi:ATP-dependent Clp protease ATP-binding subunit ClpA